MDHPENTTEREFLEMLEGCKGMIRRIARLYSNGKDDALDLEQEICLQLWKAFPSFRGDSMPSTWIYRVALNTVISSVRKKSHRPSETTLVDIESNDESSDWKLDFLRSAIRCLSEPDRIVITLSLEERSYEEIGQILGISAKAAGVRLTRAREKLRKIVNDSERRMPG